MKTEEEKNEKEKNEKSKSWKKETRKGAWRDRGELLMREFCEEQDWKKDCQKRISQKLGWERNKMRMIPLKLRRGQKEKNSEGLVSTEREHIVKPFSRSQINAFVCWLHVFLFHIINLRCNCLHYLPFLLLLLPGIWKPLQGVGGPPKAKYTICPQRLLQSTCIFSHMIKMHWLVVDRHKLLYLKSFDMDSVQVGKAVSEK